MVACPCRQHITDHLYGIFICFAGFSSSHAVVEGLKRKKYRFFSFPSLFGMVCQLAYPLSRVNFSLEKRKALRGAALTPDASGVMSFSLGPVCWWATEG